MNKIRENSQGGGIAIGVRAPTIFRDISDRLPERLKEEEVLLCQIVYMGVEIYAMNVYLNNYQKKKGLLTPILNSIIQIQKTKPQALVILAGDFNTKVNPFPGLTRICDETPTFHRHKEGKVVSSKTDWVFIG